MASVGPVAELRSPSFSRQCWQRVARAHRNQCSPVTVLRESLCQPLPSLDDLMASSCKVDGTNHLLCPAECRRWCCLSNLFPCWRIRSIKSLRNRTPLLVPICCGTGVGVCVSRNGPDEIPRPDVLFTVVSKALVIFQRLTLFRV